jgi:hypothetical protein
MATEHDFCKNMGDIDRCTDFEIPKVQYPSFFSAKWGFLGT